MRKRALVLLVVFGLAAGRPLAAQLKVAEKDLAEKYREWLKLVAYIILPVEREVFMKLSNDRDRDIFVETFWKQRDPTPGTPENEYRDEMIKRFVYVNKFLRRNTAREGWQTDMGRIYMILGPPASKEYFNNSGIVPCEAWSYYGDTKKGLPTLFNLLFWQRGGSGEYRLYDPASDGPYRLLLNQREVDPFDYEGVYEKIKEIAPTLADLSLTVVPGEYNYDYSPSARNAIIMAEIFNSPKKDVNPSYATHFLNFKGVVSTEYLTNFVESDAVVAVFRDPASGIMFCHFSIVPKNASFDFYEPKNQHFSNYAVNVSLRVKDTIIFQYPRDFPIYFSDDEVERVRSNGIAIEDAFPVVPGTYHLIVLLQNAVGKEFSVLERDITVPGPGPGPELGGPVIGYRFESYPRDVMLPFKALDRKVIVDPKNTLAGSDTLAVLFQVNNLTDAVWRGGQVRLDIRGMREKDPVQKTAPIRLADVPFARNLALTQSVPVSELAPDYYELKLTLSGPDGQMLDEKKASFIVSAESAVGHPIAHAKGVPLANQYLFAYMLAQQWEKLGRDKEAGDQYEAALKLNPASKDGAVLYGNFLLKVRNYERALEMAERLVPDEKRQFEGYHLKGRALLGLKRFPEAIAALLEANKVYNSDLRVLNALGESYLGAGDRRKAVEAFEASLKLNPSQPEVKALLAEAKK
jgi:GWxTD domain-containing protein